MKTLLLTFALTTGLLAQTPFARDLSHPEEVGVADRAELRDWKRRRSPWLRRALFYLMLAMIPVVIFGLLLYVARHT